MCYFVYFRPFTSFSRDSYSPSGTVVYPMGDSYQILDLDKAKTHSLTFAHMAHLARQRGSPPLNSPSCGSIHRDSPPHVHRVSPNSHVGGAIMESDSAPLNLSVSSSPPSSSSFSPSLAHAHPSQPRPSVITCAPSLPNSRPPYATAQPAHKNNNNNNRIVPSLQIVKTAG